MTRAGETANLLDEIVTTVGWNEKAEVIIQRAIDAEVAEVKAENKRLRAMPPYLCSFCTAHWKAVEAAEAAKGG